MGVPEMGRIAELIGRVLDAPESSEVAAAVKKEVRALAQEFPLYPAPVANGG
jgi:glycine/serine hydroxymethyltransferase